MNASSIKVDLWKRQNSHYASYARDIRQESFQIRPVPPTPIGGSPMADPSLKRAACRRMSENSEEVRLAVIFSTVIIVAVFAPIFSLREGGTERFPLGRFAIAPGKIEKLGLNNCGKHSSSYRVLRLIFADLFLTLWMKFYPG